MIKTKRGYLNSFRVVFVVLLKESLQRSNSCIIFYKHVKMYPLHDKRGWCNFGFYKIDCKVLMIDFETNIIV